MINTFNTIGKNYRKCSRCLHFRALRNAVLGMGLTAVVLSALMRMI